MKIWKRMLMSIAGVGVLVCGAFMLPTYINHYNDQKDINKIKYVDSKTFDVFKYDSKKNMADKFALLNDIYNNENKPNVMQIPFEPDEEQRGEIQEKVVEELEKWFETGPAYEIVKFYLDISSGCQLKGLNLYSIYNQNDTKLTYLEVTLLTMGEQKNLIKVYVDSNDYKIYLVSLEQGYLEQYIYDAGADAYDLLTTNIQMDQAYASDYFADIIKYYELDNSNMIVQMEVKVTDKFVCNINSSVVWSAELDWNSEKEPIIYIGIRGFENQFSDIKKYNMIYSDDKE